MLVSSIGIKLIKHWEKLRLLSYQDMRGIWTIGWGSTGRGNYPHRISSVQADHFLKEDIRDVEKVLNHIITTVVLQTEFDALASWVFNIGGTRAKKSTLIKRLNAKAPRKDVASEFLRWNWATLDSGEKVQVPGLTNRREMERQLFLTGKLPI